MQEMDIGQGAEDIDLDEEGVDPETTLQQLKWPHVPEKTTPRKNVKATNTSIDPIMLTEGDLFDIDERVREVTKDALQEMRME